MLFRSVFSRGGDTTTYSVPQGNRAWTLIPGPTGDDLVAATTSGRRFAAPSFWRLLPDRGRLVLVGRADSTANPTFTQWSTDGYLRFSAQPVAAAGRGPYVLPLSGGPVRPDPWWFGRKPYPERFSGDWTPGGQARGEEPIRYLAGPAANALIPLTDPWRACAGGAGVHPSVEIEIGRASCRERV